MTGRPRTPVPDAARPLLEQAADAGRSTEVARLTMVEHAARRQQLIRRLHEDHGISVRVLATELGVAHGVVQAALHRARAGGGKAATS